MSDDGYKVPCTTILAIEPHGNADRLEIATVYGFQCVVSKGTYRVGDSVVYIPIDSILPDAIEEVLFPTGSKITLHHHRVRQIRIRGRASQGMIVRLDQLATWVSSASPEQDISASLGIKKYEPPVRYVGKPGETRNRDTRHHPLFHKYNGLENIKWFPNKFKQGDLVVIQEKLHGTNARAAVLPYAPTKWWQYILKWARLVPQTQRCYGSNNVDITARGSSGGFYGEDVYGKCFEKHGIHEKLQCGETVYGEIIGPGIQKGYTYGLNEHRFILFDVKLLDGRWLSPAEVAAFAAQRGFEVAPAIYSGPFNKEAAKALTLGPSLYCATEIVREGIVIKAANEYSINGNKQSVKWVSETYLDDDTNTDDH